MIPLKLDEKTAFRMRAQTFEEYVDALEEGRDVLRIRRREARIDPAAQALLASYPETLHWVVLVADDAPETLVMLPLFDRLAAISPRIDLCILSDGADLAVPQEWRQDAPDLAADPDLPLLLIFDEDWQLQEQWGPFPQAMEPLLDEWLERHPQFESPVEEESEEAAAEYARLARLLVWEMRAWFNTTLDRAVAEELCRILRTLANGEAGNEAPGLSVDGLRPAADGENDLESAEMDDAYAE